MKSDSTGTTIIELLCCLLLLGILSTSIFAMLRTGILFHKQISSEVDRSEKLSQTMLAINGRSDQFRLLGVETLKIHKPGSLGEVSGRDLLPASELAKDSQAITILELTSRIVFQVKDPNNDASVFCSEPSLVNSLVRRQASPFLALLDDGVIQVSARFSSSNSGECQNLSALNATIYKQAETLFRYQLLANSDSARTTDSASIPTLSQVIALVEVQDCFSIYVDNKQTLRRLSHTTEENQALVYGVVSLRVSETPLVTPTSRHNQLIATIQMANPNGPDREDSQKSLNFVLDISGSVLVHPLDYVS